MWFNKSSRFSGSFKPFPFTGLENVKLVLYLWPSSKRVFLDDTFLIDVTILFWFLQTTVLFKEVVSEVKCLRLFECHGTHVYLSNLTFDSWCKCPFMCFPSDTEEPYDALLRSWFTLAFSGFFFLIKEDNVNHQLCIQLPIEGKKKKKFVLCTRSALLHSLPQTCVGLNYIPENTSIFSLKVLFLSHSSFDCFTF